MIFALFASLTTAHAATQIIYLAYQGPLTGGEAELGKWEADGVKLAIKTFNQSQQSYQVKLIEVDDQGDPAVASKVAPGTAIDKRIIGLIGPAYSGATIASLPYYKAHGLVMISPSATRVSLTDPASPDFGGPVFHRIPSPVDFKLGKALSKYATAGVSSAKVFVFDGQSVYAVPLRGYVEAGLKQVDPASLVGGDSVPNTTTDFSPTIAKIKTFGATVVIYTGYYSQAAVFIKQLRDSGSTAIFAGGDGVFNQEFPKLAGASAEGTRMVSDGYMLSDIISLLAPEYKTRIQEAPGIYAPQSIDAANIFLQGIKAGNLTRVKMLSWVKSYRGVGLAGNSIEFDDAGDSKESSLAGFIVKNQSIKFQGILGKTLPTPTPTPKPITKTSQPSFSLVNVVGNKINISVNLGSPGSSRPDQVYLVAPKLGILDSSKLFGNVSGSIASWSIDFDKLLSGTAIPLKVVGVKNGVESEPVEQNFNAPAAVDKLLTNNLPPAAPKNVKSRIVGTSAVISAEATIKSGALATQAYVFGSSIGLSKSMAISGDIVGTKVLLEVPLKASMAGKRLPVTIYLSNQAGDSLPAQITILVPAAPKLPSGTIKLPTQTKAPKTIFCIKGPQTRTFAASNCPPGWKVYG